MTYTFKWKHAALFAAVIACAIAYIAGVWAPGPEALALGLLGTTGDVTSMIRSELARIGEQVRSQGEQITGRVQETDVRLTHVEQLLAKMMNHRDAFASSYAGPSIGAQVIDQFNDGRYNAAYQALKDWNHGTCRIKVESSIRAILTNEGAGTSNDTYIPSQPERRGLVPPVQRPLRLLDVLPSRPVSADSSEFVQLTSDGDASEQDQEGDEKAEIDFAGELVKAQIATIAGHTTASRQVLSDHAALQAAIDGMIRSKLMSRLEHQLINGTGAQGKIKGLLAQATAFVPTIATEPADQIGEALTTQANYGYQPNLVIMNPMDWFRLQITKTQTEGEYLFGSPTSPLPPALWNVNVVTTPSLEAGKVLTVDTSFTWVLDREQVNIMLSNSHSDYFIRNLVAILGELRAGLEVLDTRAIFELDLTSSGA